MPLCNLLALHLACERAITYADTGDLVFHISYRTNSGQWIPNDFAHVGIVVRHTECRLGTSVDVLHMGTQCVEFGEWSGDKERVELIGSVPELDSLSRQQIVDTALSIHHSSPSLLAGDQSCYLMGDPHPNGHPTLNAMPYGFSCATFAHHCYSAALPTEPGQLVATDAMPVVTASEALQLLTQFPLPVQPPPFRRLYPGYLIGAFHSDEYPFHPDDWHEWRYHGRFIPDEMLG